MPQNGYGEKQMHPKERAAYERNMNMTTGYRNEAEYENNMSRASYSGEGKLYAENCEEYGCSKADARRGYTK